MLLTSYLTKSQRKDFKKRFDIFSYSLATLYNFICTFAIY